MSSCLLVYSSVTGNTRLVAEAIKAILPGDAVMHGIEGAPSAEKFDFVITGFWVHRGAPDPQMANYMKTLRGKSVAFFGTLSAYPDSAHALGVIARTEKLLEGNRILGSFLCQGKLAPKIFEQRINGRLASDKHPMTNERRERLIEAMKHPDERDLINAQKAFSRLLESSGNY